MEGKISIKHFKLAQAEKNSKECIEFIRRQELKRDQIVAITMHETHISEADNSIALLYRTESIKGGTPFDELSCKKFNSMHLWHLQAKEVKEYLKENPQLHAFSINHTPRNTMEVRNQILFYAPQTPDPCTIKYMSNDKGNWDELIDTSVKFLNKYIPPHQLVSIDYFEDMHPNLPVNGEKKIYCAIMHTAGEDPAEVESKKTDKMSPSIYQMKSFISSWDGAGQQAPYDEAVNCMNQFGWNEGHVVAGFNVSADEKDDEEEQANGAIRVVVVSWSRQD